MSSPTPDQDPSIPTPAPAPKNETVIYFAYGSNILTERLEERIGATEKIGNCRLPGHKLAFNKLSTRKKGTKSGKCNVVSAETSAETVPGVLFRMTKTQFDELNRHEGGYIVKEFEVDLPEVGKI